MFCRTCGASIPEDSQFCLKCGVPVIAPISATPKETAPEVASAVDTLPEKPSPGASVASTEKAASSQTHGGLLLGIGFAALVLWVLHYFWYYGLFGGLGGAVFDPRSWLLGIPVYLLYRRSKKSVTKSKLPPATTSEAVEVVEVLKIPEESRRPAASRWARLGIFLCVALASAILAAVVFLKDHPSAEQMTANLTKVSLSLGLTAWGLGEVVGRRWLTLKRTWTVAIALYSIAFVLLAVFLGKPLSTKIAELNEEQALLDQQFKESATGKMLLQPESFASPQLAAVSLKEFEQYADATGRLDNQKEALLLQRDDPSLRDRWAAYFEATRALVSATEEVYRFAAEPSRHVHVENGFVIIEDIEGYNNRIDVVNNATKKLRLASAGLGPKK